MRHASATEDKRSTRRGRRRDDEGAALVEFALIAPFLFLLVFAIIDFGWVFGQHLDVRHGAREGARLAAVNFGGDETDELIAEICSRMDADAAVTVALSRTGAGGVGESLTVTVRRPAETLTGFVDFALSDVELSSTVTGRIEQEATWVPTATGGVPCS